MYLIAKSRALAIESLVASPEAITSLITRKRPRFERK